MKLSDIQSKRLFQSNGGNIIIIPTIIDIEASGFGKDSYPIEVGVAHYDGSRFCKLIKPFDDWQHWDENAEKLHGISRSLLFEKGIDGVEVCLQLNEFIGSHQVYSDGWVVDSPWLVKLYSRAQIELGFRLSSIEMIMKESQYAVWDKTKTELSMQMNVQRHRASNDATLIQHTYVQTNQSDTSINNF